MPRPTHSDQTLTTCGTNDWTQWGLGWIPMHSSEIGVLWRGRDATYLHAIINVSLNQILIIQRSSFAGLDQVASQCVDIIYHDDWLAHRIIQPSQRARANPLYYFIPNGAFGQLSREQQVELGGVDVVAQPGLAKIVAKPAINGTAYFFLCLFKWLAKL